ncbi:MAG: hypothetical protein K8R73_05455 [Clostridiales bacterium]|nr:hypothetical protein [Clostridiales bacterium]
MKRTLILLILCCMHLSQFISFGNSAQPPSIVIIVPDAPDDLMIGIEKDGEVIYAGVTDKILDKYYEFYYRQLPDSPEYIFSISYGSEFFEIKLGSVPEKYNNVYTLDLSEMALIPGKLKLRSAALVVIRVVMTLILEGLLFWFFAFRKKESWIAFLVINLMTQIALNIWITGFPINIGYSIFGLFFAEILIVIFEMALFFRLVREHSNSRKACFVIIANVVSFIAGGYMITLLPI